MLVKMRKINCYRFETSVCFFEKIPLFPKMIDTYTNFTCFLVFKKDCYKQKVNYFFWGAILHQVRF